MRPISVTFGFGAAAALSTMIVSGNAGSIIDISATEKSAFYEQFDPSVDSSTLPLYGLRLDRGIGQGVFDTSSIVVDSPVLLEREQACAAIHSITGRFEAINVYERTSDTPAAERWRLGKLARIYHGEITSLGPAKIFAVVNVDENGSNEDPCAVEQALYIPVVDTDEPNWTHLSVAVNTSGRNIAATLTPTGGGPTIVGRCTPADEVGERGALVDTVCRFFLADVDPGTVSLQVSFGAGAFSDTPEPVRIALPARR